MNTVNVAEGTATPKPTALEVAVPCDTVGHAGHCDADKNENDGENGEHYAYHHGSASEQRCHREHGRATPVDASKEPDIDRCDELHPMAVASAAVLCTMKRTGENGDSSGHWVREVPLLQTLTKRATVLFHV